MSSAYSYKVQYSHNNLGQVAMDCEHYSNFIVNVTGTLLWTLKELHC